LWFSLFLFEASKTELCQKHNEYFDNEEEGQNKANDCSNMNQYITYALVLIFSLSAYKTKQNLLEKVEVQPVTNTTTTPVIDKRDEGTLAEKAMVSSAHPLATKVGLTILKKGGNAVDAAIAVQFALAVVYPSAGNIGGGGFMVIRLNDGTATTLDYREMAPALSHRDMYLDEEGNAVSELSRYGQLSVGVPGSVAGMFEAHEKFGSGIKMQQLIQPAIDLARNGFPLLENEAEKLNANRKDFEKYNPKNIYFREKEIWKTGDTLVLNDLAQTLERISVDGEKDFYEGITANMLAHEMKGANGIISLTDLKNYQTVWRKPILSKYKKEYTLISMGPPSSGGIALSQMLRMLEDYGLSTLQHNQINYIHLLAEVERRAYADRATHLGDMDYWEVPVEDLLDASYLKERMSNFSETGATPSDQIKAGNFKPVENEETTHFSVVDAEGNAVSVTTTLNGAFGSKVFVSGAGFLLNNEMDDFSAKPGTPNLYGLVGAEANAIEPGKRMLSSMTPTIVEKNGKLFMVVGSPGGSTIITSVMQTFLNVVEFEMTLKEAIESPRFHHQWLPDQIYFEKEQLSEKIINSLNNMQHNTKARGSIGRVDAILVKPNGTLEGYSDKRGEGAALGF